MKMKAAVMTQVGKPVEIREVELAEPKAHEVPNHGGKLVVVFCGFPW